MIEQNFLLAVWLFVAIIAIGINTIINYLLNKKIARKEVDERVKELIEKSFITKNKEDERLN